LTEIVVVISLVSVLLSTATAMLVRLMRQVELSVNAASQQATVSRLADRFRRDVHAAAGIVQLPEDENGEWGRAIRCQFADGRTVLYEVNDHRLSRTETMVQDRSGREIFLLPEGSQIELRVTSEPAGRIAELRLDATLIGEPSPPAARELISRRRLSIQAVAGRDLRWAAN
jgi:type II secretory pathway pseudopilin PulG